MKHKKDERAQLLLIHRQSQVRFIVAFLIAFARIMLIPPSPIAKLIILVAILALLFTFEIIVSPETKPSAGYE